MKQMIYQCNEAIQYIVYECNEATTMLRLHIIIYECNEATMVLQRLCAKKQISAELAKEVSKQSSQEYGTQFHILRQWLFRSALKSAMSETDLIRSGKLFQL